MKQTLAAQLLAENINEQANVKPIRAEPPAHR